MNRRIAKILAGSVVAATLGMVGPGTGASAAATCTGTGVINLSPTIGVAVLFDTAGVSFSGSIDCLEGGSISVNGTFDTASCGRSGNLPVTDLSTNAVLNTPGGTRNANVTTVGSVVVITGEATGAAQATPTGGSCTNGTASGFQVTGTIVY